MAIEELYKKTRVTFIREILATDRLWFWGDFCLWENSNCVLLLQVPRTPFQNSFAIFVSFESCVLTG